MATTATTTEALTKLYSTVALIVPGAVVPCALYTHTYIWQYTVSVNDVRIKSSQSAWKIK